MPGAGTESYTAAPMGDVMRSGIRNFIMKNCFWHKRSIQKYHTRTFFTLLLCISLLLTLSAGATPVYAEETSAAAAAPASGTMTSPVTVLASGTETSPVAAPASGTEASPGTETPSESKIVRVGYFSSPNFQEGGADEHKRGAGYEYLQKIASLTGWSYEYVYASFGECLEMLENGEIDLMGDVSYTLDRSRRMRFSAYPQGSEDSRSLRTESMKRWRREATVHWRAAGSASTVALIRRCCWVSGWRRSRFMPRSCHTQMIRS